MKEQTNDIRYYMMVLKTRKRYFIIPAAALFILVTLVAFILPPVYESTSTILIEEQQIPPDFVRSTVTGFADQRIQSLTQQILSRTRLLEIIKQFNLYPNLKEKRSQEEIVEMMRDNIRFDTISAQVTDRRRRGGGPSEGVTIAFQVSYRGGRPDTVQKVAGTLASLYLEQNLKIREEQAQSTTKFLQAELKELEDRIQLIGGKISKFKEEHEGVLPELQQFNLGQAERLENEIKQVDNSIRGAEDRRFYLEGQLASVKPDSPIISGTGERVLDPQSRLHFLEVLLADLRSKFSDNHPDIQKALREKTQLEKLVNQKGGGTAMQRQTLEKLKADLAEKQGKYTDQHPEIKKLKAEIARLEETSAKTAPKAPVTEPENPAYITLTSQIQAANNDIMLLKKQRQDMQDKLNMYRTRLEETPKVEQEYLALQRDYQNAHTKYQEVMNKLLEARISEGMEEHQKGEKFTLIDPASFPEKPVSPKRWLIMLAGLVLSLGVGLGVVATVENLDHSIKTSEELAWRTGIPVLGAISKIQTETDLFQQKRRRRLIATATGISIVLVIILFHFLYMDLWILVARLLRLADKYT